MYNQKGISTVMILLIIGLIVVVAAGGYFVWQYFSGDNEPEQVVCAQDAKLCPDGSYVSRIGLKCEFAQCPSVNKQPTEWNDLANPDLGFVLKYPSNFFDEGHEPKIFSVKCNYKTLPAKCPNVATFIANVSGAASTKRVTINDQDYCKYSLSDAAAGSVYYYDYYATVKNGKCIIVELDTSTTNCDNYTTSSQDHQNCVAKNNARPGLLEQIVSTFQFPK